jgi:DNA-binding transcriptional LysR family regulator
MPSHLLDPRALEVVRAVGVRGGVGAAAELLHVTPSAVSQTLTALSREVGTPVTHRVGRGVRLTPAGEALAAASVEVGVALERARAACDALRTAPGGTVTVSAFASGARMLFPGLLTWAQTVPGLQIVLADGDVATDRFTELTDEIDVVIGHHPESEEPWAATGRQVVPLLREPLDVALPLDHRLADRRWLTPEDLAEEQWISVREGFPVAEVLAAVTGGAPRVTQRLNDFSVVEALVSAGHGISLLPRYTTVTAGRFRLLPLRGVRAARSIAALARPDRAERLAVRRVLDQLVAQAESVTGDS